MIFGDIPFVSGAIVDEKPLALVALLKLFDDNAIITDAVASKQVLELMRNLIEVRHQQNIPLSLGLQNCACE